METQIESLKKELKQLSTSPSIIGKSGSENEIEKLKKENEELNRELNSLRKIVNKKEIEEFFFLFNLFLFWKK